MVFLLLHVNQHCPYVYFDCFRSTRALHRGNQWPMASPAPAGRNHFWFKISYFAIWHLLYSFSLYPLRGTWQVENQPLFILSLPFLAKRMCVCRLPLNNYEETEFNNGNGENREERRKKEVEDLISKYAKKKENEEVISGWSCQGSYIKINQNFLAQKRVNAVLQPVLRPSSFRLWTPNVVFQNCSSSSSLGRNLWSK